MRHTQFVASVGLITALALAAPTTASAQGRGQGRAQGGNRGGDRGGNRGGSQGRDQGRAQGPDRGRDQGQDRGQAARRGSVREGRPPVTVVVPNRNYYRNNYYRSYRPSVNLGFFYGSPGYYGSYGYGYGRLPYGYRSYGYGYPAYGYDAPYGYGYDGYSGRPYGGVRIVLPQRDAEVYADGYFVGTVDNFDGVLQQANLEAGPHRIEIRDDGYEPIVFDVNVEPGRTITYRASMRPLRPFDQRP